MTSGTDNSSHYHPRGVPTKLHRDHASAEYKASSSRLVSPARQSVARGIERAGGVRGQSQAARRIREAIGYTDSEGRQDAGKWMYEYPLHAAACATRQACWPAAPPKQNSVNPRLHRAPGP